VLGRPARRPCPPPNGLEGPGPAGLPLQAVPSALSGARLGNCLDDRHGPAGAAPVDEGSGTQRTWWSPRFAVALSIESDRRCLLKMGLGTARASGGMGPGLCA
jgi:hypothetical protein